MGVSICIHRSAQEIGGNCIEILASTGERLLLDAGRPLDTPEGIPTPIPATLDTTKPVSGILLSHAHSDHCGLLETLPVEWPVYCGKATEVLLRLAAAMSQKTIKQPCVHWESGKFLPIGPFKITPRLIDHSSFDAYALQIDVDGKTILYSGDFRAHGRKAKLTFDLMDTPPQHVDALIMEGTNLPKPDSILKATRSEGDLQEQFISLFRESRGRVFVSWASTNIDRTVTLYKACQKSGRVLVPDLYCMLVLKLLKPYGRLPQAEWKSRHLRAVVTNKMSYLMERIGESDFVEYLKKHQSAMSARALAENPEKWVIMARSSLLEDYAAKGIIPVEEDTWVWSMWQGYLEEASSKPLHDFFAPCRKKYIHSSGHASADVLRKFADAMKPKLLLPVHGAAWKEHQGAFSQLRPMANGQWIDL
ncbi:MAG: MBL fold metallo-hydrolase [Deltaproteobacteria bacterium]|jgi:ribonuclease J|nr:MBL fold metallo-hydrolase [Deltaproteobacteria bacterium]